MAMEQLGVFMIFTETFSQINVGPTTPILDPYDIFIEIWDRKIMEHIASETNKPQPPSQKPVIHGNMIPP